MAARAISSATISFGLVSIPVKLYTTTESSGQISFNMLHQCGTRVKQQYWCPTDEKVVPREEMVKGYEFAKGKYVTFTTEEIKALEEESSQMIEIREFLPLSQVDPLHFERAYYLGPDKGGDKPYTLLSKAMEKTGRCAIASWAARGKQYLVLVRPFQGGLILEQLHYADELRSFDEVERINATVTDAELSLAERLIEQIAVEEFHPEKYEDSVKKRLEQVIAQKVEGQEVTFVEAPEPQGKIIDLMEALRASLAETGGGEPAARKGPKRAAGAAPAAKSRKKASSRR
ncbi:MAG TPA: Ku protein [Myxococcota bacterium]|nr:Ku protein [Myxococcota bacterium]